MRAPCESIKVLADVEPAYLENRVAMDKICFAPAAHEQVHSGFRIAVLVGESKASLVTEV